jgi:tRNA1Val (adenine37-N6)-methyltransferase
MKVGTDAVLLGAWATTPGATSILDVGTGSGVIALMLAQRTARDVIIDGIEPAAVDFAQAVENVAMSNWPVRINMVNTTIQNYFPDKKYDLIVSNPPFFINSLQPPSVSRTMARHTASLSHSDLLHNVQRLLSRNGRFSVVLPTTEGCQFLSLATERGFFCLRQLAFFSRSTKEQERWLFEFGRLPAEKISETLLLYEENNVWTEGYKRLTSDFYR